jgi:hypothetical protein
VARARGRMAHTCASCSFCPGELPAGSLPAPLLALLRAPLLGPLRDKDGEHIYVHRVCAIWTPEVRVPRGKEPGFQQGSRALAGWLAA